MSLSTDQEFELERQIQCVVNRLRQISGMRLKGSITIHFDGSGFLGKHFTENLTTCRDSFSKEKMGRQMEEEEFWQINQKPRESKIQ